MRYMAKGYKKHTRHLQEMSIRSTYGMAFVDVMEMLGSGQYAVITIVCDDEGCYHPGNKGKFFLYRIIK